MKGRIKRKRLAAIAPVPAAGALHCSLCGRPLGRRLEWHHRVPRSEGGTETVPLHPICHRTIHAFVSNRALARDYAALETLREHPGVARFLRWIADKPADFHVVTRRAGTR